MSQTYTWEIQCQRELQRYPSDTQASTDRCDRAVLSSSGVYGWNDCGRSEIWYSETFGRKGGMTSEGSIPKSAHLYPWSPSNCHWVNCWISGGNGEQEKKQMRLFRVRIRGFELDHVHENRLGLDWRKGGQHHPPPPHHFHHHLLLQRPFWTRR